MGVYEDLGIAPLINAWGTVTLIGGSLMEPETVRAMAEASRSFVDLEQLNVRAGESIASMLGAEAACITSGATAALTIAAAACLEARGLPSATPSTDIHATRDGHDAPARCAILPAHRSRYERAVALSGLAIAETARIEGHAPTAGQIASSIPDGTAMFLYFAESEHVPESLSLPDLARAAHRQGIPVVVDAAAELPPRSNIPRLLDAGADLVILSGGKEIRGPQSSGIILGTAELVEHCRSIGFPHHGIGRGMKTDKETIAGLVKAVELFVQRDEAADRAERESRVEQIVAALAQVPEVTVRRAFPDSPGIQPATIPRAYVRPLVGTAIELRDRLRAGAPAVAVGLSEDEIVINPQCLAEDEVPELIDAVIRTVS